MSYLSSAGIARGAPGYGKTCRKDVLRGVDVPVVPGAAGRASPLPGGQGQAREQVPARRAGKIAGAKPYRLQSFPARFVGRRIPPRPEGQGILREAW
jgi:hypothetical protein